MGDVGHQLPPQAILLGERPGNAADDDLESHGERQDQRKGHRRDHEHLLRRPPEQRDEGWHHCGANVEARQGSKAAQ